MVATHREREAIFLRTGSPKSRVGRAENERPGWPKFEAIPANPINQNLIQHLLLLNKHRSGFFEAGSEFGRRSKRFPLPRSIN
ncbi:hypothetical protein CH364_07005 [Leptospira harrisiae]|uniref:Uncharacterized protein n=1 Tax=Leptospira harrisiae TaxID=2023189 RepID=A0A2N0ANN3_9LEPT|nr:hypothetical protein CH364_07005 [Leptospira harrisiae]